jgi:hypothetical protein
MSVDATIMVLGLGDLGRRILGALGLRRHIGHLVGVGRAGEGARLVNLVAATGRCRATFVPCDLADTGALMQVLRRHRPDLVVQAACLLSPWWTFEASSRSASLLSQAGFGAQLPAQLPLLLSVMTACREANVAAPVVNASYPDVTHAVLAPLGLAPTVGIGNVAIVAGLVRAAARGGGREGPSRTDQTLRVVAHHAHVWPALRGQWRSGGDEAQPRVWAGEQPLADVPLPGLSLPLDRSINHLSAASALELIEALLAPSPRQLHAPGPVGLPGGYPVLVGNGRVTLDLPAGLSRQEASGWLSRCARQEGIERIEEDGTVHLTAETGRVLRQLAPALAEPFHPRQARERGQLLRLALGRS